MSISQIGAGLLFTNAQSTDAYYFDGTTLNLVGVPNYGTFHLYSYSISFRLIPSKFIPLPYVLGYLGDVPDDYCVNCFISIVAPYLGTIDNLSTPVVKTANQTMKVIYTITNT